VDWRQFDGPGKQDYSWPTPERTTSRKIGLIWGIPAKKEIRDLATPVGHILAGYAIYGFTKEPKAKEQMGLAFLAVFAAIAPDLDLLPGLLVGKPALYHGGISHSLGFALMVSLGAAGIMKLRGKAFLPVFSLSFLAYSSHLLLDWLGPDGRWPFGIPVFWPISSETFLSPAPVFLGVHHAGTTEASIGDWLQGVFSLHNVVAVTLEAALITPLVFLFRWLRTRWGIGIPWKIQRSKI
jgi:inner membrane protein